MKKLSLIGKCDIYTLNSGVCLGEGSFGKVYEAIEEKTGAKCAIKLLSVPQSIMSPSAKSEIDRETENIRNLNSENIVSLLDSGEHKGSQFFVFEYCESDLEKHMKSIDYKKVLVDNKFTEDHKKGMFNLTWSLLNGFKEIFIKNLIHRDIKPSNLLISKGVLKIADFGFSRMIDNMFVADNYTRKGTPFYASYEILKGEKFSAKCDVYSCGIVIYQMFFGVHPYFGDGKGIFSVSQILMHLNEEKLKNLPQNDLPQPLIDLIKGMIRVKEKDRLNWRDVFLKMVEIFGEEQGEEPEIVEKCIYESINEGKKPPLVSGLKEILCVSKSLGKDRLDILNKRMQINSFYQKVIYYLIENDGIFTPLVKDQLILSLNMLYEKILEEDSSFIINESSQIDTPQKEYAMAQEKIKKNSDDCKQVILKLKAKILSEITRSKKKSMFNRYFELLITQENAEVHMFELFISWNVLMQRKSLLEKIKNGTTKMKESFLLFNLVHSIDHSLIFKKPKTVKDEFYDPSAFRDSVDELSRTELNSCVESWLRSI